MKTKKPNSLSLKKNTISSLGAKQLNAVNGGYMITIVCTVSLSALVCEPTDDPYGTRRCLA